MYLLQYNIQLFQLHVSTPMSHLQALIFKNYQYILSYSFLCLSRTIAIAIPLCITKPGFSPGFVMHKCNNYTTQSFLSLNCVYIFLVDPVYMSFFIGLHVCYFGLVVLISVIGSVEDTSRVVNAHFFSLFRYFEEKRRERNDVMC